MCDPANLDLTHREIVQVIVRHIEKIAENVNVEYRLPNNRIADIYWEMMGVKFIAEAKTILKASLIQAAYGKYSNYCDYLILATPPEQEPMLTTNDLLTWRSEALDRVGLWHVTWMGIFEQRPARGLR